MAKRVDLKAKAKRQKIMAGGGALLLLALLAFQVPRMMKMLNQQPPPIAPAAAPSTVPGDPSVLPTPGTVGGGAAPTASGGGTLVDSDLTPAPATGQLVAFGRFASKDPFEQQIDERAISAAGGGAEAGSKPPAEEGSAVVPGGGKPGAPAPPAAVAGSAVIAVNGAEETVAAGSDFPHDSPVFKLVKLTSTAARIAIAGGSFASGSPTVTLEKGKTITLVNTADGTRYELKLVSIG
jgi:hypothetical protein